MKFKLKLNTNEKQKLEKILKRRYDRTVNEKFTNDQANKIILNIKAGVRSLKKGVGEDGKRFALPALADATIKSRADKATSLHAETNPKKGNITATGQLLDAMKSASQKHIIIIGLADKRSIELDGRISKLTNSELKNFLEEKGFIFFNIPTSEIKRVSRELRQALLKEFD